MTILTVTKDAKLFSPGDKVRTKLFGLISNISNTQVSDLGEGDFYVSYSLENVSATFRWLPDDLELLQPKKEETNNRIKPL